MTSQLREVVADALPELQAERNDDEYDIQDGPDWGDKPLSEIRE